MATNSGAISGTGKRSNSLKYFYLNSDLHRILRIVRPSDLVECWNYREEKRVMYVWSDTRKRLGKAFTLQDVSKMIGRHRVQLEHYILDGNIRTPQRIYSLDGNKRPGKYLLSEQDVLELHDYLLTVHIGRPRKDGRITPGKTPTKAELRAMMKHELITYVKTSDNEFRPMWKEIEW